MSQVVGLPNNSYKPITNMAWVRVRLCKLQKRMGAASDKVYQLLTHGQWFSPGTPASSTTKTGRHDIFEILLKVALSTKNIKNQNQIQTCRVHIQYCQHSSIFIFLSIQTKKNFTYIWTTSHSSLNNFFLRILRVMPLEMYKRCENGLVSELSNLSSLN